MCVFHCCCLPHYLPKSSSFENVISSAIKVQNKKFVFVSATRSTWQLTSRQRHCNESEMESSKLKEFTNVIVGTHAVLCFDVLEVVLQLTFCVAQKRSQPTHALRQCANHQTNESQIYAYCFHSQTVCFSERTKGFSRQDSAVASLHLCQARTCVLRTGSGAVRHGGDGAGARRPREAEFAAAGPAARGRGLRLLPAATTSPTAQRHHVHQTCKRDEKLQFDHRRDPK